MTDQPTPTSSSVDKKNRGRLFILSAPSGTGKTTLCAALLKRFPEMRLSISHTTRNPRKNEQDGVHYHFITEKAFKAGIDADKWVEWARVHDNFYGTSADFIDEMTTDGIDVVLDIDVQGARQLFKRYPDSIGIFIMPPSLEALRSRLESRGDDSAEVIQKRLTRAKTEMAQKDIYHHIVVNDKLADAIDELTVIVQSYRG